MGFIIESKQLCIPSNIRIERSKINAHSNQMYDEYQATQKNAKKQCHLNRRLLRALIGYICDSEYIQEKQ